jgi:hypothetical protein
MKRALILAALLLVTGCTEAPRGHADPNAAIDQPAGQQRTEQGKTTKIPMH